MNANSCALTPPAPSAPLTRYLRLIAVLLVAGQFLVGAAISPAKAQSDPHVQDEVLDTSFGGDGRVVLPFDLLPGHDIAQSGISDGQGGYWVVGRAQTASSSYVLAVARLTRDGTVAAMASRSDLGFEYANAEGPAYQVQSMAVDADGRLLLVVLACTNQMFMETCTSRVLRIARDGAADTSFDGDGEIRLALSAVALTGVTPGPNREVWVSGSTVNPNPPMNWTAKIFRYDDAGAALEPVAASDHYVTLSPIGTGGYLGLTSSIGGSAEIVRLDATGALDSSFGDGGSIQFARPADECGVASTNPSYSPRGLSVLPDGRAVVHVDLIDNLVPVKSMIVGLGRDATPGAPLCIADLPVGPGRELASANAVAIRDDGRVFVADHDILGPGGTGLGMHVFRLQDDGRLDVDPQFNAGQPLAVPFPYGANSQSNAGALSVLLDRGAPVLIGAARNGGPGHDFALARMIGTLRVFRGGFEN